MDTSIAWKYNDGADKRQVAAKVTPVTLPTADAAATMSCLIAGAFAAAALF